jgi:ketosteroid isomerase-like protein
MKRILFALLILALAFSVGQPTLVEAAPGQNAPASEEALIDAIWAYEEALESGKVEDLLAFFAEDAYALPPGATPVIGKEALAEFMGGTFNDTVLDREFELVSYTIAGDYATRLGEWTNTFITPENDVPTQEVGRCVFGYEFNGTEWKIAWQIWNYSDDLPPEMSHDGHPC